MFKSFEKRLLLDRGPSWPDYDKVKPFWSDIIFYFVKGLLGFPFNIFLHKILKSDLGDLHDHYWPYITVVLKGGYWETTEKVGFGGVLVI